MPANPAQTFVTETDARVAGQPEGNDAWLLVRFSDGDVYQWLTNLDIDELLSYGVDGFEIVEDDDRPAFVDTSDWDDRDNG